jgi:hypothetical protein
MTRVVGFVASPRKGMNTDTLVSEALAGAASAGAQTEKVYLNDLAVKPCQACGTAPTDCFCVIHDGMDTVYRFLEDSDAIVIGTPAYYETVADSARDPEAALACLRLWFQDARIELSDRLVVTGADRGSGARSRADLLETARAKGAMLAQL